MIGCVYNDLVSRHNSLRSLSAVLREKQETKNIEDNVSKIQKKFRNHLDYLSLELVGLDQIHTSHSEQSKFIEGNQIKLESICIDAARINNNQRQHLTRANVDSLLDALEDFLEYEASSILPIFKEKDAPFLVYGKIATSN